MADGSGRRTQVVARAFAAAILVSSAGYVFVAAELSDVPGPDSCTAAGGDVRADGAATVETLRAVSAKKYWSAVHRARSGGQDAPMYWTTQRMDAAVPC